MNILEKIIARKKQEVEQRKNQKSVAELEKSPLFKSDCQPLDQAIRAKNGLGIIAEFKRRSPSKGIINDSATVEQVTSGYLQAGAAGLSVLTDIDFFGGSDADLQAAQSTVAAPILRKDFVVDEYQILEAKAIGADAILLIAACLTPKQVKNLAKTARNLGLQVLLELHRESELDHFSEGIELVGVNNRNLDNFEVSVENSLRLLPNLPNSAVKISESGISDPAVATQILRAGFDGLLIGENFMKTADPAAACSQFLENLRKIR